MSAALLSAPTYVPEVSADYPTQRYFHGADGERCVTSRNEGWDTFSEVRVYREAGQDVAELSLRVTALGIKANAEIEARLTPAQLREVAQRLLDAAADIEKNPAAALRALAAATGEPS